MWRASGLAAWVALRSAATPAAAAEVMEVAESHGLAALTIYLVTKDIPAKLSFNNSVQVPYKLISRSYQNFLRGAGQPRAVLEQLIFTYIGKYFAEKQDSIWEY